ncbi:hypothetical protein AMATHDRAFT_7470 [Amanita thiersii Skay4041]|uniref:IPT/TIG domain-containing protein n=1 Tax=Amanita thiersii Skay4041 TaxID=703135 RepID=A0A2A9NEN6_9AGAR|nr:hypothetical protein AMATHDRAFT_7470 [Amanita thiersii Skay4041]
MSSSSSSAAAPVSRSPSPHTPEASDSIDPVTIQSDIDINSSWFISSNGATKIHQPWDESLFFLTPGKSEDDQMLHLDDLIEPHAYHDPSSPGASSSQIGSPQTHNATSRIQRTREDSSSHSIPSSNHPIPSRNIPATLTKPVPPPATLPRKPDPSSINARIVYPPKDSCFNLPILFPNIPENGTKSRVETQVRVTVDLAEPNLSTIPYKYDRVGSWKWLKLPSGTATKRRTRKQGKIDPEPQDILHLSVYVTCATPPHNRVFSCTSCQTREAKRVAKKLAARVRPARSDSESNDDPSRPHGRSKQQEDTTSIIQFNCAEILDFSTGSVVLPLRITCYCRHHREKTGFLVNMQMSDHNGRVIGFGQTKPIMITDDHKTASSHSRNLDYSHTSVSGDLDWSQIAVATNGACVSDGRVSTRRNKKETNSSGVGKKRPKPYDSSAKPTRPSREGSVSSLPSPSAAPYSPLPGTRSPTPSSLISQYLAPDSGIVPSIFRHSTDASKCSTPDIAAPVRNQSLEMVPELESQEGPAIIQQPFPASSNTTTMVIENQGLVMPHPHPMPFMFFDPSSTRPQSVATPLPTIHRLVPNVGPTHGGIEVTVLGANFLPAMQLRCIFGGVPASSTQRWSDNTLVCILPPRGSPGVVSVWIDNYHEEQPTSAAPLFTYSDESDRTLMELALQVVGLKMTGKIEDAKDVAMRIVGTAGENTTTEPQQGDSSSVMQLSTRNMASTREILPLLLNRNRVAENFENLIIDFLTLLDTPLEHGGHHSIQTIDAISHPSVTGQTLLHYAASLNFDSLTRFLVEHGADLDARDLNGFTPLHFAALAGSKDCLQELLEAGADKEIVNAVGKIPAEVAQDNVLELFQEPESDSDSDLMSRSDDEEAVWGDGEEDATLQMPYRPVKRASNRNLRRAGTSGSASPVYPKSSDTSRTATPPIMDNEERISVCKEEKKAHVDVKQTAWFMEMLQRTFAQLQAPQGIIPNIPQLPLPNLPHLPDLSAVPWNSLPQIPIVFPVFVPMPGWPSFLQHHTNDSKEGDVDGTKGVSAGALRTAQEFRAFLEKWVALAAPGVNQQGRNQQPDDAPPPRYTPRAEANEGNDPEVLDADEAPGHVSAGAAISIGEQVESSNALRPVQSLEIRPVGYGQVQLTDQEVNAYGYQPSAKQAQKLQKKREFP